MHKYCIHVKILELIMYCNYGNNKDTLTLCRVVSKHALKTKEKKMVSFILSMLFILNILSIIAVLFFEKKDPVVTLSWTLILTFLPAVGLILYLLVGRGFKSNNKKIIAKLMDDENFHKFVDTLDQEAAELIYKHETMEFKFNDDKMSNYYPLIKLNYLLGYDLYTQNNDTEIFTCATKKYDALLNDIENAETSINLLYFIFKADVIGTKLINALTKKAAEGVEVRLIYDHLGSLSVNTKAFDPIKKAGGLVHRFMPVNLSNLLTANYRNHRKIAVIDGKVGYVGGINIGDEYMGLSKITPWRDTHIKIKGSAVYALQARFLMDWHYVTKEKSFDNLNAIKPFFPAAPKAQGGTTGMQIVSSGPDTKTHQIKVNFIKMFGMAKKSILIQTPYLIPDNTIIEALQIAASSGVDVKIMIPGVPDKKIVYQITKSYIQDFLDYNIKVYCYPGFIHAKMVVIDDEIATIGTCNMDMRSLSIHYEINAFLYDTKTAEECSRIFKEDLNISKEIIEDEFKKRSIFNKFTERLLRLLAPLM